MRIKQWVRRHRLPTIVFVCAALGFLIALYGSAGQSVMLQFALPQGWAAGAITFALLTRGGARGGREAVVARWMLWSTLPVLLLGEVARVLHHQRWDAVLVSGYLTLLIGLELAARTPVKVHTALQRILRRGILHATADAIGEFERDLQQAGQRWSVAGAWCVFGALLITWPDMSQIPGRWRSWDFGPLVSDHIVVVIAGAVVGGALGRMAGYGRFGKVLAKHQLELEVAPGHPDGAAGLKPIGDFYLYQSLTASLPAIFLATWVLLISLGGPNQLWGHYRPFLHQYLWLLVLAILFEILAFILPMNSIHAIMRDQKEDVLFAEADLLSAAISAAQARLDDPKIGDMDATKQHLQGLVERYQDLERTPTWPIDSSIRRRFTLRNLGLLTPFLGYLLGQMPFWQQISDVLRGLG